MKEKTLGWVALIALALLGGFLGYLIGLGILAHLGWL